MESPASWVDAFVASKPVISKILLVFVMVEVIVFASAVPVALRRVSNPAVWVVLEIPKRGNAARSGCSAVTADL